MKYATWQGYKKDGDWASFPSYYAAIKTQIEYCKRRNYPSDIDSLSSLVKLMKAKQYFQEPADQYLDGVKVYDRWEQLNAGLS